MPLIKLINYIENADEDVHSLYHFAMNTFFGESLFPDNEDAYGSEIDLGAFEDHFGSDIFNPLYNCALENFFSNEYIHPSTEQTWNIIDQFLASDNSNVSDAEAEYLKAFRNSYMNLYEITTFGHEQKMTVRSMIALGESESFDVNLQEDMSDFEVGDVIAARLISTPQGYELSGVVLDFEKELAEDIAGFTMMVTQSVMTSDNMDEFSKLTSDPQLALKKMWVKEIAHGWFSDLTEASNDNEIQKDDDEEIQAKILDAIHKAGSKGLS